MRRPRETIDAAMLATAIGVDRTVETDIWRVVAGDDLARGIERDRGLEGRQFIEALPAIVERNARLRLEAAALIGLRPATASSGKGESAPAGLEGAVTGGCLRAFEDARLITRT